MRTREDIRNEMRANSVEIDKLNAKNRQLHIEDLLLSDDKQWYIEENRTFGKGKNKVEKLMGSIHWKQEFKDEGTGEGIWIERSQYVRENGEWLIC
jgi:hypothetical protein